VGRQDRGTEANPAGIVSSDFSIAHPWLAYRDRADLGHDLPLRQMAAAHNTLAAFHGLEIGVLGEKIRDLGLYCLSQLRACGLPQDFGGVDG
jgi:hypothetical protein